MATNARLPSNMSFLRMQHKHVTKALWEGNERLIRPRRHSIGILKHSERFDASSKFNSTCWVQTHTDNEKH